MKVIYIILIYILFINLVGLLSMGIDKQKARKRAYRIPEATLFTIAIIGGSIGSIVGMFLFHHKTRHWYFLYGMPVILFLQIAFIAFLIWGPFQISVF